METLLRGKVFWSYDHEVANRNMLDDFGAHMSGIPPFHRHSGEIVLSENSLYLLGDVDLDLPLAALETVYLGFDEIFPPSLVKNMGLFWQPLKIKLHDGQALYLIIDYNLFGTKNQLWFDALKSILSN